MEETSVQHNDLVTPVWQTLQALATHEFDLAFGLESANCLPLDACLCLTLGVLLDNVMPLRHVRLRHYIYVKGPHMPFDSAPLQPALLCSCRQECAETASGTLQMDWMTEVQCEVTEGRLIFTCERCRWELVTTNLQNERYLKWKMANGSPVLLI